LRSDGKEATDLRLDRVGVSEVRVWEEPEPALTPLEVEEPGVTKRRFAPRPSI
jgi:hypothetical protein